MGELVSFMGLKFSTVFRILFEVPGRVRTRIDRQFRVASTTNASLYQAVSYGLERRHNISLPAVVLKDSQHAIQKSKCLSLHSLRVQ